MTGQQNITMSLTREVDSRPRMAIVNPRSREAWRTCAYCGRMFAIELLAEHEQECPSIRTSDTE